VIFGHAVDLCHKVEVLRRLTCADGHGWPRRAGPYASDLLAGHGSGAAIELEAPQVRACRYLRSGWHRTDLGRGWRGCQARSARRLAGRDCGRDRQQPRGLAAAEDHGRALVGQPKPGSWIALATLITDFQRQHRRNLETGCRCGTEGGEVAAEECCIAPRCRVEPFLDQGGSAALRRARPRSGRAAASGGRPAPARRATARTIRGTPPRLRNKRSRPDCQKRRLCNVFSDSLRAASGRSGRPPVIR
jgi:hypothetical protein